MNSTLFLIGPDDYTGAILSPSYNINKSDVSATWTDGNGLQHSTVYRTQISGEFTMLFGTAAAFETFRTRLDATKTGAYNRIMLYVNNTGTLETIDALVEVKPALIRKGGGRITYDEFDVKITQR